MSSAHASVQERSPSLMQQLVERHLPLVIALTVVALTGTFTAFQALRIESQAGGADAESVAETLGVASRQINAEIAARAYQNLAGEYVTMMSKADAIAATDPPQAMLERNIARDFAIRGGILPYLSAQTADATFDYARAYRVLLRSGDVTGVPAGRPAATAKRADRDHRRVRILGLDVVGLLAVIVLITLARVTRERTRRLLFESLAAAAYLGLLVVAVVEGS
jgi:hypothetical protein